jgi:hypothetical protein
MIKRLVAALILVLVGLHLRSRAPAMRRGARLRRGSRGDEGTLEVLVEDRFDGAGSSPSWIPTRANATPELCTHSRPIF